MTSNSTSPASPVPFHKAMEFAYGRCDRLSPLVRRVIANNPSPFTLYGTGTYIIGTGSVAVIDPGPADEAHLDALLTATKNERISHILITHTHSDHSPLAAPLQDKCGAPIYGMALPQRATQDAPLEEDVEADFTPDEVLQHGQEIAGADWTLTALHTPGHIANHFCFGLQEEQTLFCGDHIMAWATTIIAPPDGSLTDYFASLNLLLERDDRLYWPTHGPAIDNPHDFVRAVRKHREWRNEAVLACLQEGAQSKAALVATIYADIDKKLHGAAAHSLQAHLDYLETQGRIACTATETYSLVASSKSAK